MYYWIDPSSRIDFPDNKNTFEEYLALLHENILKH